MPKEDLNQNAKRNVVKTSKYTHLMQKGACKVEATTKGDTLHTVLGMKEFAFKHANQTKKLANALLGLDLKQTIVNDYSFMYSHFQYEADEALQQMRSPQCAWSQRFTGIDCKSYSIFASTLLINQGINHFIRRVKQPNFNPDYWSHVYVIVPIDQENLNLDKGYYTIDGTLHSNTETPYLEKHDIKMSGLKHVWLNGPGSTQPQEQNKANLQAKLDGFTVLLSFMLQKGVSQQVINEIVRVVNIYLAENIIPIVKLDKNGVTIDRSFIPYNYSGLNGEGDNQNSDIFQEIGNFFKDLDFDNLFSSIDCIGGTAFNDEILKDLIPKIVTYFSSIIEAYNQAILNKNFQEVHKIYKSFWLKRHVLRLTYEAKKTSKNWNSCSNSSFDFVNSFLDNKIWKVLGIAFQNHIETYFNLGQSTKSIAFTQPANTADTFDGFKLPFTAIPNSISEQYIYTDNVTLKTQQIPAFVITPEVEAALNSDVNSTSFNVNGFLQSLANTAPLVYDIVNGNTTGSNTNQDQIPGGNQNPLEQPEPQKAGISLVQGIVLTGIAGGIIYSLYNSKPNLDDSKKK